MVRTAGGEHRPALRRPARARRRRPRGRALARRLEAELGELPETREQHTGRGAPPALRGPGRCRARQLDARRSAILPDSICAPARAATSSRRPRGTRAASATAGPTRGRRARRFRAAGSSACAGRCGPFPRRLRFRLTRQWRRRPTAAPRSRASSRRSCRPRRQAERDAQPLLFKLAQLVAEQRLARRGARGERLRDRPAGRPDAVREPAHDRGRARGRAPFNPGSGRWPAGSPRARRSCSGSTARRLRLLARVDGASPLRGPLVRDPASGERGPRATSAELREAYRLLSKHRDVAEGRARVSERLLTAPEVAERLSVPELGARRDARRADAAPRARPLPPLRLAGRGRLARRAARRPVAQAPAECPA